MRRGKLIAALLVLVLLTGCAAAIESRTQSINPIDFYYCRSEPLYGSETGAIDFETAELGRKDVTVEQIMQRYLSGPESEQLRSPFPQGLVCTRTELDGTTLSVYLSSEYSALSGVELSLASACLSMTLTQIEFVDSVRVLSSDGRTPAQLLEPEQFVLFDASAYNPERTVTLYFRAKGDKLLHSEPRTVAYTSTEQLPQLAVQALLEGAMDYALLSAIPENTQLIDLSIADGVCSVMLSEAFAECDTDEETALLAVRQLTAMLCGFDTISSVHISLLDGSELSHLNLSQNFSPDDSWYAEE